MNLNFAQTDYNQEEIDAVIETLKTRWIASGPQNEAFEKEFAEYVGTKFAICVNSGSSANLLALASLKLPKGSRILTSSGGFPATLSPILHLGLEPILVDYELETHNINRARILEYLFKEEVDTVIFAHTLGNPIDVEYPIFKKINLIEDCCEAVGSTIHKRKVGSFGTLGTFSFYPAHQITCEGTGGMIVTNNEQLAKECRSLRDWGKVWDWDTKLGDTKTSYVSRIDDIDYYKHYTYHSLGYNMKLSETAAAFGRVQIRKLDRIRERRIENYDYLSRLMEGLDEFIHVKALPNAEPSWFGYPLTLSRTGKARPLNRFKEDGRKSLGDYLESVGIRTRPFFAGNITRHKPFRHLYEEGKFPVADKLMRDSLFIGIGQWMGKEELNYIYKQVEAWCLLLSPS